MTIEPSRDLRLYCFHIDDLLAVGANAGRIYLAADRSPEQTRPRLRYLRRARVLRCPHRLRIVADDAISCFLRAPTVIPEERTQALMIVSSCAGVASTRPLAAADIP